MSLEVIVSLLVNSVGAFLLATILALGVVFVLRVRDGRLRVALLSLPFAKLVFDLARGVPDTAFLWAGPMVPETRSVLVGVGIGAPFALRLHIVMRALAQGREYALSVGDYVVDACRRADPLCLPLLACALCLPASMLLARRCWGTVVFERERRRLRLQASRARRVRLGLRVVDVYEGPSPHPTPFSGGLVRPYVCIPDPLSTRLSAAEHCAILEHELAHVRTYDVLVLMWMGILSDLFWFVPGIRVLARHVAHACELCADDEVARRGAQPVALASALVLVAQTVRQANTFAPIATAAPHRSHIAQRVDRLLAATTPVSGSRSRRILRIALGWFVFAVTAQTIMISALGGSY